MEASLGEQSSHVFVPNKQFWNAHVESCESVWMADSEHCMLSSAHTEVHDAPAALRRTHVALGTGFELEHVVTSSPLKRAAAVGTRSTRIVSGDGITGCTKPAITGGTGIRQHSNFGVLYFTELFR